MFGLEQSIAEWRRQMQAAGIKMPVPLEELESHLREDITQQIRSGLSAQQAFEIAVQRIGQPGVLKSEFQKAKALAIERIITIAVGTAALLEGLAVACLPVTQGRHEGTMAKEEIMLFVILFVLGMAQLALGMILVFDGSGIGFLASKRKARPRAAGVF